MLTRLFHYRTETVRTVPAETSSGCREGDRTPLPPLSPPSAIFSPKPRYFVSQSYCRERPLCLVPLPQGLDSRLVFLLATAANAAQNCPTLLHYLATEPMPQKDRKEDGCINIMERKGVSPVSKSVMAKLNSRVL